MKKTNVKKKITYLGKKNALVQFNNPSECQRNKTIFNKPSPAMKVAKGNFQFLEICVLHVSILNKLQESIKLCNSPAPSDTVESKDGRNLSKK